MATVRTGVLAAGLAALLSGLARGGTGEIVDGELNLLVYFAYDEEDPSAWEPVFTEYSRLLSNATEGGLQLGTVAFTVCPELMDEADVWVLSDYSGARAHLLGLGVPGAHITISQLHKTARGTVRGQFGLAHETGHYVWGCYDEYRGFVGGQEDSSRFHYCSSETGVVACLMDGGTTISPQNQRTEFCTRTSLSFTETAHFRGVNSPEGLAIRTDQEYFLRRSCWDQIQLSGQGGLVHPAAPPSQADPPHAPVTFDYERFQGTLAVALVIDRSGSMSAEDRLVEAVQGAKAAIGLLRDGESFAVIAFDDVSTVLIPMTTANAATKAAANAALDTLLPGGGTILGTAVLDAVSELARVTGCVEIVVALTDGISSAPDIDEPAVVSALAEGGHAVFGIALGSFPETGPLNTVSVSSGGRFFAVPDAGALPGTLASIFAQAGSGVPVTEAFERSLASGETQEETFEVGEPAEGLEIGLSFAAGAAPELVLTDPLGVVIPFDAPPAGVETYTSEVQKVLRLPDPTPGTWTASIHDPLGVPTPFDFLAFVRSPELSVTTRAEAGRVSGHEPMRLSVNVVAGVPVAGVEVAGSVHRPDGSTAPVVFHDDGLAVHGDAVEGDGVYGALFARYAGDGAYVFDVTVDNVDGEAASNLECGAFGLGEDGQEGGAIPPFTARASHTVVLDGFVSPSAPARLDLAPHSALAPADRVSLRDSEPTAVAGFSLTVTGDEPVFLERLELVVRTLSGAPSALQRLSLRRDEDRDGEVDETSLPLARGRTAAGGASLVFGGEAEELLFLEPGVLHAFLLTAGDALAGDESSAGIEGGSGGPGGPGGPGGSSGATRARLPGPSRAGLAVGALVLLLLAARGVSKRGGRRIPRLAATALFFVLVSTVLVPACTSEESEHGGAFEVEVSPGALHSRGAVTELSSPTSGVSERFAFELR